jgi:hypothetical protein
MRIVWTEELYRVKYSTVKMYCISILYTVHQTKKFQG